MESLRGDAADFEGGEPAASGGVNDVGAELVDSSTAALESPTGP
jgi:hypothetical protein